MGLQCLHKSLGKPGATKKKKKKTSCFTFTQFKTTEIELNRWKNEENRGLRSQRFIALKEKGETTGTKLISCQKVILWQLVLAEE